ncbi:MAG TPA: DegV family protein [Candidatus Atribacteria bacterium]|nr:DegV family protein [Candidatus Atribacteria bacterium]
MSRIQIVTDSTAYFTKAEAEALNIKVVPLAVTFEGVTENEGYPGEFESFFNKLETSQSFPTTSQPSIEAFASVFQKTIDSGKEVICLVISAALSGTFNSASVAAELTAPDKISVIDSKTTVANLKYLVKMAVDMAEKGMSRSEIVKAIEEQKEKTRADLTVDTLEYLKRGGRLTGAQAFLGSLLNVRPIIGFVDGKLIPVNKVRGKSKALEFMMDRIPENVAHITVCHILNEEEAEELKARLRERFPGIPVELDVIGPVIGSHLGPKAIGICQVWK